MRNYKLNWSLCLMALVGALGCAGQVGPEVQDGFEEPAQTEGVDSALEGAGDGDLSEPPALEDLEGIDPALLETDPDSLSDEEQERIADAIAQARPGEQKGVYRTYSAPMAWFYGTWFPRVSMLSTSTHVCALSKAVGRNGEQVEARVYAANGRWYLYSPHSATAVCYPHSAFRLPSCPSGVTCFGADTRTHQSGTSASLLQIEGRSPTSTSTPTENGYYAAILNGVTGSMKQTWNGGYVVQSTSSSSDSTLNTLTIDTAILADGASFAPRWGRMVQLGGVQTVSASSGSDRRIRLANADRHMCYFTLLLGDWQTGDEARILPRTSSGNTYWYLEARSSYGGEVYAQARCMELDQR